MDTRTGKERIATLIGRSRTALTLAALVAFSAFATDTVTPASAHATSMMMNDVSPSEIVTTVSAPRTVLTRIKSGMASWYGSVLQGHLTASGRRFNENELTAAHRTLPFGSKVKVTDLRNKRTVVVTITDRGILFPERVIDLSFAAARELGMVKMGVDPVRLELVTFKN